MNGSDFFFNSIGAAGYKFRKIGSKSIGCFSYKVTAALNHENIVKFNKKRHGETGYQLKYAWVSNHFKTIKYKLHILRFFKKSFLGLSIRMLNLPLKELRSIVKSRNIDGYKSTSKNQLISLITKDKLSSTPRPAFKIEE